MKLLIYLILLFPIAGQAQIYVSGKVSDKNKLPVPFVNVSVSIDSLQVGQTMTDSLGNYSVKVSKTGYHNIFFRYVSFESKSLSLNVLKDTILDIELNDISKELSEVVISTSNKILERKSDRYVMNVSKSVTGMGGDAFLLLEKIPGIKTSSRQISLVGKGDITVTIDDKILQLSGEDLISFLKTIPSGGIDKIEVITNPSSRYEAQGSSGIVNIVMKKNMTEGYNATVNLAYKQHKYSNFNENASLSFNKGKWNLNGNLSFATGTDLEQHAIDTYYSSQSWYLHGDSRDKNTNFNSSLDVQYRLSEQTKINVSFLRNSKKSDKRTAYQTNIFDLNNQLDSITNSTSELDKKFVQSSAGFQLQHNFKTSGKLLTIGADWLGRTEDKDQFLLSQNYPGSGASEPVSMAKTQSINKSDLNVFTVNTELKLPLNGYDLSVGGKLSLISLNTNSKIFENHVFDQLQSPVSVYRENRQAMFSDLKKSFDKWKFQLGLRVEYTQTNGTSETIDEISFKRDYFQLFPSLIAGYSLNENNNFDLTYGRRINRPAFRLLDPFRSYTTAYDYWEGNPFLRPSVTNNLDISHTFHNSFTTTFSYSVTKDNFEQIAVFKPNNVVAHEALNYMDSRMYQLMFTKSLKTTKWLETNLQLQGYHKEYVAKISSIEDNKITGWYLMIINQVQLNKAKTISAEIAFRYQSSNIDLESTYQRQYNLDFGFKALLLKKKVSLGLNVSDLLQSNYERLTTKVNNIRQNFYNYWEPRSLRVSLQYKFGQKKNNDGGSGILNPDEIKR